MQLITRWWWIRHGPTNASDSLMVGQTDLPASLVGCEHALSRLVAYLPTRPVWVVSPMRRARETVAALVAAGTTRSPELIEQSFTEQSYGAWDGMTYDAIAERYPDQAEGLWFDPAATRPPEGETFVEVVDRVGQAIVTLNRSQRGRDIAVMAHSGTVRAALAWALDMSPQACLRIQIGPLSLTRIDHVTAPDMEPQWSVEGINLIGLDD
jgi:alpha-ribazole phosphatase